MPSAKEEHAKICEEHQNVVQRYVSDHAAAYSSFEYLADAYGNSKQALLDSGALKVGEDGNIKGGWYKSGSGGNRPEVETAGNAGVYATGSAAGLLGAIGAPAAAWVLVGHLGTASTGAAISGLSGAAATSATAAWFGGGAVSAGGLGMAAAPFVLTGIGAAVGVGILGIAALVAARRNNRNENEMKEVNATIKEAERRMEVNSAMLDAQSKSAKQISTRLIKATGVLEATKTDEAVVYVEQALTEAEELLGKLEQGLPHSLLYIGKPSPVSSVKNISVTPTSVTMDWEDPDGGASEITGYRVRYVEGSGGMFTALQFTRKPLFKHVGLKLGTTYRYQIISVNKMGEGKVERSFDVKTLRI